MVGAPEQARSQGAGAEPRQAESGLQPEDGPPRRSGLTHCPLVDREVLVSLLRPALCAGGPALLLGLSLVPKAALAQDAIQLKVERHGQEGGPNPGLGLVATESLDYAVSVRCGAADVRKSGALSSGQTVRLDLATGRGRHRCQGELSITLQDGSSGSMPLDFTVDLLRPLVVKVPRDSVDLAVGKILVHADRPVQAVEVELFDESGRVGGGTTRNDGKAPGAPVAATWMPLPDNAEVIRVQVKVTDVHGFWGGVDLFPWYYEVPHEDVVFASGQSAVVAAETPKLDDALARIQEVEARYGKYAPVRLYVAGFTDTVGNAASNRTLSEARASAIARWFQSKGFGGEIYYQGFGEKGLAVSTPDETDEERNRRATYIVAAEAPPVSGGLPGSAWTPLR